MRRTPKTPKQQRAEARYWRQRMQRYWELEYIFIQFGQLLYDRYQPTRSERRRVLAPAIGLAKACYRMRCAAGQHRRRDQSILPTVYPPGC